MVIVLVEVMHKFQKLCLTGKAWAESMLVFGKDVIFLQVSAYLASNYVFHNF